MQDPDQREHGAGFESPQVEPGMSAPTAALVGSIGVAIAALALAALKGAPYLDLSSLNVWVAVFAVAAFGALFSVPFALERLLVAARPERTERWERAMLLWGLVALVAIIAGGLLIAAGGFSPSESLPDAAGLLLAVEAGMVVVTLVVWLLSG
jgi:hypothetical protein